MAKKEAIRKKLSLKDKPAFDRFFALKDHELAVYSFANVYAWRTMFDITWEIIDDALCVYFQDGYGVFLYFPPLSRDMRQATVARAFVVMDDINTHPGVSRIANIEQSAAAAFAAMGYDCSVISYDYICSQDELSALSGNRFKSKRAAYNYAVRHYSCEYGPYQTKDEQACRSLYAFWMADRMQHNVDHLYQGMLKDGMQCLDVVLKDHAAIGCAGRVARADGEIKGFTFGYEISPSMWCVLFEVTDLSVRGLAQYIFRHVCREMRAYKNINCMDDSGIDGLARVKRSYRPWRRAPSYTARRQ
jgi:uncharacterized protein